MNFTISWGLIPNMLHTKFGQDWSSSLKKKKFEHFRINSNYSWIRLCSDEIFTKTNTIYLWKTVFALSYLIFSFSLIFSLSYLFFLFVSVLMRCLQKQKHFILWKTAFVLYSLNFSVCLLFSLSRTTFQSLSLSLSLSFSLSLSLK